MLGSKKKSIGSNTFFDFIRSILWRKDWILSQAVSFQKKSSSKQRMLDRKITIKNNDLFRVSMLQVLADEIIHNNVQGECAEVGVHKGQFARCINAIFPTKKLYLFDTFSGFDSRDLAIEHQYSYSSESCHEKFQDTSSKSVLNLMPHQEQCIIKEGFFPDTSSGVEERWSFVSIDCDLYSPVYEALHFFHPNLEQRGYILIHDFNSSTFKGVRHAVEKYCSEKNISYIPLSDPNGSVIIVK